MKRKEEEQKRTSKNHRLWAFCPPLASWLTPLYGLAFLSPWQRRWEREYKSACRRLRTLLFHAPLTLLFCFPVLVCLLLYYPPPTATTLCGFRLLSLCLYWWTAVPPTVLLPLYKSTLGLSLSWDRQWREAIEQKCCPGTAADLTPRLSLNHIAQCWMETIKIVWLAGPAEWRRGDSSLRFPWSESSNTRERERETAVYSRCI